MDELVHHCLRELSFDGDLGCNVSRLKDFIVGFYASQCDHTQLVDDSFCAFVWSAVVQQPSVRVGNLPPGLVSEVYIAPQTSAKRKAAAKGEEVIEVMPSSLEIIENARHKRLEDLEREYGDNLRIAVDPETSFTAITGSHIRPAKLSPMVYSALQLITRGREDGITTVDLGRKTGYDQKTCFYLVKQLVELGLVIKARRGGVGNHICIHKYFVERSPLWQQIQKEARNGEAEGHVKLRDNVEEATLQDGSSQIQFDPIDSRHLSSLPLVKNRIVKLLRASRNHIHQSNNLLMTIGFVNPTKTDRRFFQSRLRELIQQGVIERVLVPSGKAWDRTIKCIRLVTSENRLPEGSVVVDQDAEEDEKDASVIDDSPVVHSEVKANLTIYKQVSNILEEAGPSGLTLNEICVSLGNFDKRTVELLLTRASNNRPPAHLSDLGTVDLMETYGRERRHRYFTLAAYKCVMVTEQLQDATPSVVDVDLSRVGDFAPLNPKCFYTTTGSLNSYQDSLKDVTATKGKKRKRDEEASDEEESGLPPKPKRGRPRKTSGLTDTPASTPRKRGRPRKGTSAKDNGAKDVSRRKSSPQRSVETGTQKDHQTFVDTAPTASSRPEHVTRAPVSGSGLTDRDQQPAFPTTGFSSIVPPIMQTTALLQAERLEKMVEVETHGAFEEGTGVTKLRHSTRCSLKHAETFVVNANKGQNGEYGSGTKGLDGSDILETDGVASNSTTSNPISVEQESPQTLVRGASVGEKHKDMALSQSSRPSKRSRISRGGKSRSNINISSLRRENELLKVIENLGGIVNLHSKDLFEAHTALLDTMSQAKESTSAPVGTRLDKRTAESSFKSLENRGRLRMLKTSIATPSGISRPACLVYLPDIPQEKVNAFLRQLSQIVPSTTIGTVKVLEEPVEYGPDVTTTHHTTLPLNLLQIEDQDEKGKERLCQLFSYDRKTIREVLLTERTTVAQLYGFVVGKVLRMRQLHLHALELFQQPAHSSPAVFSECRIIDVSYFYQDIPLAVYCSLVAVAGHDEELDILFSGQGKQKKVNELSKNLHMSMGIGKSRSKARILELLELLRSLGLVIPLERTEDLDAPFKGTKLNGDTIAFRNASLEGWSASTPMLAPLFWHFRTSSPIHLWALSESSPSYWKEHHIHTLTKAEAYWDELYRASRDQAYAQTAACPSTSPPMPTKISTSLGRCLRRRSSWDPEYALTWHQKQYLNAQMQENSGKTPLSAEDVDAQLDQSCYVTSAPRHVVIRYFGVSGEKLSLDTESARQRIKGNRRVGESPNIEAKLVLRKKAEEAVRSRRKHDRDDLRRIRPGFTEGTLTVTGPPPVVPNPPEKSVKSLIDQQGPPITQTISIKRKGKAKEENEASRRPRFHWTREFDELARDASAIIRARCRSSRLDLSALDQVFPAVPRNSVRQRITHLRDNPAEDLYMKRLEDQWNTLWLQYRGTTYLPDEDPGSPFNFQLIEHIEFLRNHVDKNALRVGFMEREVLNTLVTSVNELYKLYEVGEDVMSAPIWDFMWNATVEEGREKQFRSKAFTKGSDSMYESSRNEKVQLAEEALKMVFGTPNELYDPDRAARLLHSAGEQCVSVAKSNLLRQGVLSKLVRDPKKRKPGRMLKISDINLNAVGGPFPRDLFQDAISLEEVAIEKVVDEMEWPLIPSEGDIAALLQLVSEDQVEFNVDLSQSRAVRQKIDWNSKRADDEDIETDIRLRFSCASIVDPGGSQNQFYESPVSEPDILGQEMHGTTTDGKEAACTLKTETGLINCSTCIRTTFANFTSSLVESDRDLARRILDNVRSWKGAGLGKTECLRMEVGLEQRILWLVHKMTLTSPPILFWTYFNNPLIVAGDYCDAWSVVVSDDPLTLVVPRRWLDLQGYKLDGAWRAAQQAVVGVVFLHPGVSQAELRWRLRLVYDRQEIMDVLSSLEEDGVLEYKMNASVEAVHTLPGWIKTLSDEESIFWFIAKHHRWYQI